MYLKIFMENKGENKEYKEIFGQSSCTGQIDEIFAGFFYLRFHYA